MNIITKIAMTAITILILTFSTNAQMTDPDFAQFNVDSLLKQMDASGSPWLSFFDGEKLFTGIYRLKAGSTDKQEPHKTDEVYYVIGGKAKFEVNGETSNIGIGDVLFVKANAAHHFYEIEEELVLLVFFEK